MKRKITMARVEAALHAGNKGFCLACGAGQHGVEPDAEGYRCTHCGAQKVMGAEQLCLLGMGRK